ncbi:MarR family winged helix-turn-helix transcriptional regulator [Saccharopolyspora cebuensis]|uniref:MarR family winged helix-turn-helix transcriptional regulator n=1 Tax=Saccharopolyspora cebuensis TaxID=418759 RepID=A0ABV4CEM8_9PSEU
MQEPRWLTDVEQRAWRKFAALITVLPAALESQLQRDEELTHFGYWVLAMLSEAPGEELRMTELATRANASPSRVSHVVARLEQRGWVVRHRAPADGRGSVAELTGAGRDKLVGAAPGHVDNVRSLIFDGLTERQVAQLDELCGAILHRIDPDGELCTEPPG